VLISHWLQGKCARINLSQAASGIILQNDRRLSVSIFSVKITAVGSLKRVTGRIFKISEKISKGQAKTLSLIFSSTKKQKIVKLSEHLQKVPIYWQKPSKKYSPSETIPLRIRLKNFPFVENNPDIISNIFVTYPSNQALYKTLRIKTSF
jgi:hypothetical protein